MANKNDLFDFDETTAANNDNIQGANVAENCAPSGINNAIRGLASIVKRAIGSQGGAIASAATTPIGAAGTALYTTVTGTTTITGFGTVGAGTFRIIEFTGSLALTHDAGSLKLPGAANIVTAAGDIGFFISLGSGNWKCLHFTRASGKAVVSTVAIGDIPNDLITYAKMQNVSAASRLLGRGSAGGAGDPEEITLGSGLSLSGTDLDTAGPIPLQRFYDQVQGPQASSNNVIPHDDSTPSISEGTELFSRAITPKSATSRIHMDVDVHFGNTSGAGVDGCLVLFRGSTCIAVGPFECVSNGGQQAKLQFEEVSGSTSARTYSLRYGTSTASVTTINDTPAGDYGNLIVSSMTTTEYQS